MNDVLVTIYLICFVALFGATFAFMWKMMSSTLSEMNKPKVTKLPAPHPEMEGVRYGEKLLVFREERDDEQMDRNKSR